MSIELFEPLTKPTAAQLNALAADQVALNVIYPDVQTQQLAEEFTVSGTAWGFVRVHRWLLYNSTGQLKDPSGINDSINLPDPDDAAELGVLDLNTVKWLQPGMVYRVTGCAVAWEQATPPG